MQKIAPTNGSEKPVASHSKPSMIRCTTLYRLAVGTMQLDLLTVSDVAEVLGLGSSMVRKLDRTGVLPPCTRTKRGYRLYRREEVDELARERAARPPRPGPARSAQRQ
ncbi:helix-turn-helix domain-containing protein [Myxococcota bacterium]